jgi:hypothetical protein
MAKRMCSAEEPDRGQKISDEDDRDGEKDE